MVIQAVDAPPTPVEWPYSNVRRVWRLVAGRREDFLQLRCGQCQQDTETPDSTERPLRRTCGNCGKMGVLTGIGLGKF